MCVIAGIFTEMSTHLAFSVAEYVFYSGQCMPVSKARSKRHSQVAFLCHSVIVHGIVVIFLECTLFLLSNLCPSSRLGRKMYVFDLSVH